MGFRVITLTEKLNETNVYIVRDTKSSHCFMIDSGNYGMVNEYIQCNNLVLDNIILTHEHFDHIFGVNELREKYHCKILASEECSKRIQNPCNNMARYYEVLLTFRKDKYNLHTLEIPRLETDYVCEEADFCFQNYKKIFWRGVKLELYETPGHSKGSICIVLDEQMVFSGDSLLFDYEVILRFPGGSRKDYEKLTIPFFKTLDPNMEVCPGHGRSFILKQRTNPL